MNILVLIFFYLMRRRVIQARIHDSINNKKKCYNITLIIVRDKQLEGILINSYSILRRFLHEIHTPFVFANISLLTPYNPHSDKILEQKP